MYSLKTAIKHFVLRKAKQYLPIAVLLTAPHTQALTIQLTDIGTTPMSPAQMAALVEAAQVWESIYIDAITVNVGVAWEGPDFFSNGSLASNNSTLVQHALSDVKDALVTDFSSSAESLRHSQIPMPLPLLDINGFREAEYVSLTASNAKALGLSPGVANFDAEIIFNLDYLAEYDLDRNDGIDLLKFDFVSTAAHELGHALGFFTHTEAQDQNPDWPTPIYPTTLVLLRYQMTGGYHDSNEQRMMTAGPAEYSDGTLNNIPFSQGRLASDPHCGSASGS